MRIRIHLTPRPIHKNTAREHFSDLRVKRLGRDAHQVSDGVAEY
ncbi:hypothetical protein SBRY_20004 [Actinacidiphila bryophytorum]|uniref:Uncharacterized protein n=1 Tax=Actinacidiphila bryophytorum TaxID=1436133 RepID=A0A9W4E3W3_9ACTN|nr:hypothetical protein SBRY_20004 [Actinacidiphila bryophytorum]